MPRDDDLWNLMLRWTAERTDCSAEQIDRILRVSTAFWEEHLDLAALFMVDEDET